MIHTVEARWFLREAPFPASILFTSTKPPRARVDCYAYPCNERWGVKTREGKVETKLRARSLGVEKLGQAVARVEEWTKWGVAFAKDDAPPDAALGSAGWVAVEKKRLLRMFVLAGEKVEERTDFEASWPRAGCQLEWTELRVRGASWWTLGLEAFGEGRSVESLRNGLTTTARHVFASSAAFAMLDEQASRGYPEWLQALGGP